MNESYIDLCCFNFGKRCYVIMKNNIKIMFFEKVNNNYEMPILSFNLYDNVGKSLTVVNQNFFMNQLINRLNVAFNKGILSTDNEIIGYLNSIKLKVENDEYLKKLFKGNSFGDINEKNFELNKREIIKYLDGFKFDMFVNYNNVSIFNGSIEKNDTVDLNSNVSYDINDFDFNSDEFGQSNLDVQNTSFLNNQSIDSNLVSSDVSVSDSSSVSSDDYFNSLKDEHSSVISQDNSFQSNMSYVDEVRKRLENNL